MNLRVRLAVVALGLAVGSWLLVAPPKETVAQGSGKLTLPDEDFKTLVASSSKVIQEVLSDKPSKKTAETARVAAIYIAMYAQADAKTSPQERATIRDAALKIADDIKAEKYEDAKKAAAGLPTLKADPKIKTAPVTLLGDKIEFDEVMYHFHTKTLGGTNVEQELDDITQDAKNKKNKAIPADLMNDKLLVQAYQTAIVGDFVRSHDPKKEKKAWVKFTEDMSGQGMDFAKSVKANKGKASPDAWQALLKLQNTCSECHKKFK